MPSTAASVNRARFRRIKQAFAGRDRSFADLARRLQVTPSAVTHVAQGSRVSRKVRRAIARSMRVRYRDLWED